MLYPGHLFWRSSGGVLAPSAMVLARAFEWNGSTDDHEAALQALHFICGRNPVNRVFVSGYGDYQHGSDFYSHFWTNLVQQPPGHFESILHRGGFVEQHTGQLLSPACSVGQPSVNSWSRPDRAQKARGAPHGPVSVGSTSSA